MRTISRSFAIAVVLLLTTALIAEAGGWAVITLDELPVQITAGQVLTLGFTVRQHGRTLRDDLQPLLHFARADTTESFTVTAEREGASGHYSARVIFPTSGQWNWRVDIEQFGMVTQDMPPLVVSAMAATTTANTSAANALPAAAGLLGLIGAAAGFAAWLRVRTRARTRARWALALVVVSVLIGVGSLIAVSSNMALATANAQPDRTVLADRGKALFQAKGCVMCHTNAAVQAGGGPFYFGDKPAPNLTHVTLSDEYLRQWLKNPAALKPNTYMPNLGLKPDEIESLIAFLHSDQ